LSGVERRDMLRLPSPVDTIVFGERRYHIKRDDLIDADFSGNKARKFHSILEGDFPGVRRIVSYGSNQSNAMYSLSVLARMREWVFEYYTDHISTHLLENPIGNYKGALENGAIFRVGESIDKKRYGEETLFVEEGGRQESSEYGLSILADEIMEWKRIESIDSLTLFLPSGTGTTALYLRKYLPSEIDVITTPCVGDAQYLRKQFTMLDESGEHHPKIVDLPRKYHFGKPYGEFYEIWLKLRRECGIEFDLLYDPKGWLVLDSISDTIEGEILYIHQGGIKGNESLFERYIYKGLANRCDIA